MTITYSAYGMFSDCSLTSSLTACRRSFLDFLVSTSVSFGEREHKKGAWTKKSWDRPAIFPSSEKEK